MDTYIRQDMTDCPGHEPSFRHRASDAQRCPVGKLVVPIDHQSAGRDGRFSG